jgi:hypothetical protein
MTHLEIAGVYLAAMFLAGGAGFVLGRERPRRKHLDAVFEEGYDTGRDSIPPQAAAADEVQIGEITGPFTITDLPGPDGPLPRSADPVTISDSRAGEPHDWLTDVHEQLDPSHLAAENTDLPAPEPPSTDPRDNRGGEPHMIGWDQMTPLERDMWAGVYRARQQKQLLAAWMDQTRAMWDRPALERAAA